MYIVICKKTNKQKGKSEKEKEVPVTGQFSKNRKKKNHLSPVEPLIP